VVAAAEAVNIHDYLNVCIGDGGGPARSSSIRTFVDSLGNTPETYHRRFANINEPQYYYCSSQIQLDNTDTCGLYCMYYFKRRHRGTRTEF
jgi:hypothetical protein